MGIQVMHNFTRPDMRTGLLWKIPLNGALGLKTLHFALRVKLWGFLKIPLTWKEYNRRNTGNNPLYPSSYKPPNLSPTCSTTRCHNNYLERPQSEETINKNNKENQTGKGKKWKGISNAKLYTVIFSDSE